MKEGDVVVYRLNERDEIIFVNDGWDRFAASNEGGNLTAPGILQTSLWKFVSDATVQTLYRELLARIRMGRKLRIKFRCDSPACRRLLEMDTSLRADHMVEFRVKTLSLESRNPNPLLDSTAARSDDVLRICSWCKKIDLGGEWSDTDEAVQRLRLFERPLMPRLSHGICGECGADFKEVIARI